MTQTVLLDNSTEMLGHSHPVLHKTDNYNYTIWISTNWFNLIIISWWVVSRQQYPTGWYRAPFTCPGKKKLSIPNFVTRQEHDNLGFSQNVLIKKKNSPRIIRKTFLNNLTVPGHERLWPSGNNSLPAWLQLLCHEMHEEPNAGLCCIPTRNWIIAIN